MSMASMLVAEKQHYEWSGCSYTRSKGFVSLLGEPREVISPFGIYHDTSPPFIECSHCLVL